MAHRLLFRRAMKMLAVLILLAVPVSAFADDAAPSGQSRCVGPAVGGAVGGLMVSGIAILPLTLSGNADSLDSPGGFALILGIEVVGMVGGTVLACHVWGSEGRVFPMAASLIVGGVAGGTLLGIGTFALLQLSNIDSNTDNPGASALLALTGTLAGIALGGFLAYHLDLAVRGPLGEGEVALLPWAGPGGAGLALRGIFH